MRTVELFILLPLLTVSIVGALRVLEKGSRLGSKQILELECRFGNFCDQCVATMLGLQSRLMPIKLFLTACRRHLLNGFIRELQPESDD